MESFQYPLRQDLFQRIESPRQLKQLLEREAAHLRINKQYFKVTLQMGRYIYARCRQCKASIKYKRDDDFYKLTSFSFYHRHEHKRKSNQIEQFIRSMPLTMSTESLLQITTRNFNISKHKFYYHHRKLWFQKTAFKEIISELDRQKHQTRLIPFPLEDGQLPDTFITSSEAMVANFKKFGENQFVTFDITYNLVKEVKLEEKENKEIQRKKWGLGLFLGKNNHNKAICFCFCILNSQTKDSFVGIFRSFFEMMRGQPSVIITDQQAAIESALKQLKDDGDYRGHHVLDTFHILRNIMKKTKKSGIISNLRDAMFSKTTEEYETCLEKTRQFCENEEQHKIYTRFINNSHKYCLSQTPQCFHGISISTSFGEKVNDFIKTFLPRESPFKLINIIAMLDEKSSQYKLCKINYEEIFHWRQLKLLRNILCETIFNALLKNYTESLEQRIFEEGDTWSINNYQLGIRDRKIECACGYFDKCGIPCSHLIKIIVATHEDIQNYIHERWIITPKSLPKYKIPKGRPRDSRRQ